MPYADAKGVKIYYESHGSGPAIMLIHGSGGHHAAWWRQVAYLSQWFTVLTIDLRGFGNSDPVEGGPDSLDFVHDVEAVLEAAKIERCALLGQSIGAAAPYASPCAGRSKSPAPSSPTHSAASTIRTLRHDGGQPARG